MSHTLTVSMSITDFTFKAILKEMVSLVIGNKKTAFHLRVPLTRGTNQLSTSGSFQVVIPAVMAVTNTPATQVGARSAPATTITPSTSTSAPVDITRVPPQMRHQTVALQGASLKVNLSATSQAMVQLLEVINKVTEELQDEEELEGADLVDLVNETVEESQ